MHPSVGQTSGAPQHFFREEISKEIALQIKVKFQQQGWIQ
jgi:hypothetical protein